MLGTLLYGPRDSVSRSATPRRRAVALFPCPSAWWTCSGARRYLPELIRLALNGNIKPGKVFNLALPLDQVAEACRVMDERRAIKSLLRPNGTK
jgi:hypothetical protein